MNRKIRFIFVLNCMTSLYAFGQNSFTLTIPVIYSNVEVANNWSPPTAVNRQNQFDGKSIGCGVNLNYSFRAPFIVKNKSILFNIGLGYFKQKFDLQRPFDYVSPQEPIYYTDHYSYNCWQGSVGVTYSYPVNNKYSLSGNLSYCWLTSFRQEYAPTRGYSTQTNNGQIDFGKMLNLSIGINRNLGDRFSIGLNMLIPVYVRWRNDKIFGDDPSAFYSPKFSVGYSISIAYRLKSELSNSKI
jgi:hypothetical protein